MQMYRVSALVAALAQAVSAVNVQKSFLAGKLDLAKATESMKKGYGPAECVTVDRSPAGTCVLRTACDTGVDLEKTEFAFLCVLKDGEVQKHSYGEGGFGSEETFDSSVSCEQCLLPTMALSLEKSTVVDADTEDAGDDDDAKPDKAGGAPAAAPAAAAPAGPAGDNETKKEDKGLPIDLTHDNLKKCKNETKREVYLKSVVKKHTTNGTVKSVSKYGPDGCISAYVSSKNTCMMKTDCKKQADAIKNYDFGLTCVEDDGKSVRHLFGTNSFDPEETFDTLIDCKLCIGLDVSKMEKKESLATAVAKLKEEVQALSKGMKEVEGDVKKLNDKVFPAPAPAPAANFVLHKVEQKDQDTKVEEEKDEDEAPAAVTHKHHRKHGHNLAHKKTKKHHHKHHKKVHHKRHREEDEEAASSDEETQAPAEDTDEAPKPKVEASEPADAAGEDEDADGW